MPYGLARQRQEKNLRYTIAKRNYESQLAGGYIKEYNIKRLQQESWDNI